MFLALFSVIFEKNFDAPLCVRVHIFQTMLCAHVLRPIVFGNILNANVLHSILGPCNLYRIHFCVYDNLQLIFIMFVVFLFCCLCFSANFLHEMFVPLFFPLSCVDVFCVSKIHSVCSLHRFCILHNLQVGVICTLSCVLVFCKLFSILLVRSYFADYVVCPYLQE